MEEAASKMSAVTMMHLIFARHLSGLTGWPWIGAATQTGQRLHRQQDAYCLKERRMLRSSGAPRSQSDILHA